MHLWDGGWVRGAALVNPKTACGLLPDTREDATLTNSAVVERAPARRMKRRTRWSSTSDGRKNGFLCSLAWAQIINFALCKVYLSTLTWVGTQIN
ncbi:Uncharacterized protein TCM_000583 [Theobroma cacao]|uniref:Uncharacterized protein n=1 Tax=Theobroma cacao TaxID=3641 RepID=A0A061DG73_THECC|nr:Uncharacterized protein TCM_000583 [Theobroma cacao]